MCLYSDIMGWNAICESLVKIWRLVFDFFLRQKADMWASKHMRQFTTWQVFCQVERRFHSRDPNREVGFWMFQMLETLCPKWMYNFEVLIDMALLSQNGCIDLLLVATVLSFRATSHLSQEPWPWNCVSPKESVQKPSQDTSIIMWCGHGPSRVVWSRMSMGRQPNIMSINFYLGTILTHNKIESRRLWDCIVLRSPGFVLGLAPRVGFWK